MRIKFAEERFRVANSGVVFLQRKEGGSFTVLSNYFSSNRTKKISPGNHSVFQKISGRGKYFIDNRGRGYYDFQSKILSRGAEKSCMGFLLLLRNFLLSKSSMDEKGVITFFRRKLLVSQGRKFRGHPFNVSENLGDRKIFLHNRGYPVFPAKNFCLTVPKNFIE